MKLLWLSRHAMTPVQTEAFPGAEVTAVNHAWQATADEAADIAANAATWRKFAGMADVIAGVFPPVAIEAIPADLTSAVVTPVSAQTQSIRADGEKKIEFSHVRWAWIKR